MSRLRQGIAALALTALAAGALRAGAAAWLPLKALVGQSLLERAWERRQDGDMASRPWAWADITPLARIGLPRLGVWAVVLSDASGEAMAWGPGHVPGTAMPGTPGLSAIAGHRDTHLAFLARTRPGDLIVLETADGEHQHYRATAAQVVDSRSWRFPVSHEGAPRLALATCWPLVPQSGAAAAGPLRLILFAEPAEAPAGTQETGA